MSVAAEDIVALMASNQAARTVARRVREKLGAYAAAVSKRGNLGRELEDEHVAEVIAAVLAAGDGPEPPWPPQRYHLDDERQGITKKMVIQDMVSGEDVALFVTLNFYPSGRPSEVFVRQQKEGSTVGALVDALFTVVSIALQHGVPWEVFADKLRHTRFPPYGWTRETEHDLRQVSSVLDYVVRWASRAIARETADSSE